jgi:phage shock protein A
MRTSPKKSVVAKKATPKRIRKPVSKKVDPLVKTLSIENDALIEQNKKLEEFNQRLQTKMQNTMAEGLLAQVSDQKREATPTIIGESLQELYRIGVRANDAVDTLERFITRFAGNEPANALSGLADLTDVLDSAVERLESCTQDLNIIG